MAEICKTKSESCKQIDDKKEELWQLVGNRCCDLIDFIVRMKSSYTSISANILHPRPYPTPRLVGLGKARDVKMSYPAGSD
ncbi:hypothetical protein Lalb_Chr21g0313211 [Lupinus albus]|uniref:Uncharacterized protein n=1 Tax=Lupinus albus TaxID=3870 RepID=A0A6A4NJZ5_LUPAL|nr:hypothetical protein Lalb_Chr21g0313211 [Lupinus albus]